MNDRDKVYIQSIYPELILGTTHAYEVLRTYESDQVSRLGWVVEAPVGAERQWVALVVVSSTGDSFLGARATAAEAIQLIWEEELKRARP